MKTYKEQLKGLRGMARRRKAYTIQRRLGLEGLHGNTCPKAMRLMERARREMREAKS